MKVTLKHLNVAVLIFLGMILASGISSTVQFYQEYGTEVEMYVAYGQKHTPLSDIRFEVFTETIQPKIAVVVIFALLFTITAMNIRQMDIAER